MNVRLDIIELYRRLTVRMCSSPRAPWDTEHSELEIEASPRGIAVVETPAEQESGLAWDVRLRQS